MRHIAVLAIAASLPVMSAPTRTCNPVPWQWSVAFLNTSAELQARVERAVATPAGDPLLAALLGDAKSTQSYTSPSLRTVSVFYDPVENVAEIAERLRAEPAIAIYASSIFPDGEVGCFLRMAATRINVTEYHNALSDHYFLSSSDVENRAIEAGAAGPGWSRTGQAFVTYDPHLCVVPSLSKIVYRFYGPPGIGPNSHFFTAGSEECGALRNMTGWLYEGRAFGAELPTQGICPANAPVPVYRAYNMRWMQNDSNHRHTADFVTYQQMIARGWAGEGVAFCVPSVP